MTHAQLATAPDAPPAPVQWMLDHRKWVFLILAALMAMQISTNWKPDPDGVNYLCIARNLALHGRLQRQGMTHLYYAPGYAILISPVFLLSARPFAEIGVLHLLLAVAFMFTTYLWFARYNRAGAIFIAALTMVNVGFWDVYRQTRAETAFMAAMMASAVLLAAAAQSRSLKRFILTTCLAALLVMITCFIRQVGILLAGGFALTMLIRATTQKNTWSRAIAGSAIILTAAASVVVGLMLYDAHTARQSGPEEVTYLQNRRDPNTSLALQFLEGFRRQTAEIGRLTLPGMWGSYSRPKAWFTFNTALYLLVSAIIAIGWWRFAKTTLDPLAITFPFYFLLFVAWPFDQGTRFTVPMLPVLAASIWYLLRSSQINRQTIFAFLILVHVFVSIGAWVRDAAKMRRWNQEWPAMQTVAAALPDDARMIVARDVAPEKWMFLAFLTDRRFFWKSSLEQIPDRATCCISPASAEDAPGFEEVTTVEGLKIQRKIHQRYFAFNSLSPSDNTAR